MFFVLIIRQVDVRPNLAVVIDHALVSVGVIELLDQLGAEVLVMDAALHLLHELHPQPAAAVLRELEVRVRHARRIVPAGMAHLLGAPVLLLEVLGSVFVPPEPTVPFSG